MPLKTNLAWSTLIGREERKRSYSDASSNCKIVSVRVLISLVTLCPSNRGKSRAKHIQGNNAHIAMQDPLIHGVSLHLPNPWMSRPPQPKVDGSMSVEQSSDANSQTVHLAGPSLITMS